MFDRKSYNKAAWEAMYKSPLRRLLESIVVNVRVSFNRSFHDSLSKKIEEHHRRLY